MKNQNLKSKGLIIITSIFLVLFGKTAFASEHFINYQGVIYDNSNNPITSELDFRFSIWSDSDFVNEDLTSTGAINSNSEGFTGYSEVQRIVPDKNGNFNTSIGQTEELPALNSSIHKFLQVEIKQVGEDDSAYEVLDIDSDINNQNDRRRLSAAPYAINAETLQNYKVGNNPGELAPLNAEGKIDSNLLENKISYDNLIIFGNEDTSDIKITFGEKISKVFKWAKENLRFEMGDSLFVWGDFGNTGNVKLGDDENDEVIISGNLTLSGSLNGRNLQEDFAKIDSIPEAYDDSELRGKILNNSNEIQNFQNLIPETYNDSEVKGLIQKNSDDILNIKNEMPSEYNDSDLLNKIAILEENIKNIQNKSGTSIFSWDFIPGTDEKRRIMEFVGTMKNKSFVMTKPGKIISVGLTTNPTDNGADGEYVITKNDGGTYSKGKEIFSISQNNRGNGDKNNSAYVNNISIDFQEGDVLRVYHIGENDHSSNIFIETSFE